MDSENGFLVLIGTIALLLAMTTVSIVAINNAQSRIYVEHGYTRVVLPGHEMAEWVAPQDTVRAPQDTVLAR
jgi:hypothetical protein